MKKANLKTKATSLVLAIMMIFAMIPIVAMNASAAAFIARTTAPSTSESCFYSGNPFYQAGYGMPNCTAYAYGRAWELLGRKPDLSLGNAGNWWSYNNGYPQSYASGQTPKLGAVVCWSGGPYSGQGHVAIVEKIDGSNVYVSESAWNGFNFKYGRTVASITSEGYNFQGYIYIGDWASGGQTTTTASSNSDNPYPVPKRNIYVTPGSEPFMKGEDVKYVQWGLNKIMSAGLNVDGIFGYASENAVKAFQRKYGLVVDGIFGAKSLEKMQELLKPVSTKTCTITFNANGGSVNPGSQTVASGGKPTLPTPTRSGYDFKGWYTATSGGSQVTNSTTINSSMTLYAHWAAKQQTAIIINVNSSYNPGTDVTIRYWAGFSIPLGARVTILDSAVDPADGVRAYKVNYQGNIGWVCYKYLRFE
ncbi:MAG: InlB B-repeat-containing protein [Oscillospiraceae bacterium]|nr:InlB B-repeat-containing protein [Oscillospiraceae bacterium]